MDNGRDNIAKAFDGYVARNPQKAPPKDLAVSAGLGTAAFVFFAGFVGLTFLGMSALSSFLVFFALMVLAVVAGFLVSVGLSRVAVNDVAKARAAERAAQAAETDRQIHRARVLGKFDHFGPKS